ncbi:hypothetical protein [Nocardia nova]
MGKHRTAPKWRDTLRRILRRPNTPQTTEPAVQPDPAPAPADRWSDWTPPHTWLQQHSGPGVS